MNQQIRKKQCVILLIVMLVFGVCAGILRGDVNPVQAATKVPYYDWLQADSQWSGIYIGDKTIGEVGCAATSVSMLIVHGGLKDESNFDPGTFVKAMKKENGFSNNSIYWGKVSSVVSGFEYAGQVTLSGEKESKIGKINSYYQQGYYMVVSVNNSGHWVAVRNASSASVTMMDPASTDTDLYGTYDSNKSTRMILYKSTVRPSNWEDSAVNVGTNFYAYIINTAMWKHITNDGDNVSIRTGQYLSDKQVWKFERQSDRSYIIRNCADTNKVLSANNATGNVYVATGSSDSQKWYIQGSSGDYKFVNKASGLLLDICGNISTDGTNVQQWERNGNPAQSYSIWYINKPGSTTLKVTAGTSEKTTTFSWNAANEAKTYNLRIYNGTAWQAAEKMSQWNLTSTSYSVNLPAGYYEAYIDVVNQAGVTMSTNVVKFTVKETIANLGDGFYANIVLSYNQYRLGLSGRNVYAQKSDNSDKQVWYFDRLSDGGYTIKNCSTGEYLDVAGMTDANGVIVQTWEYNGCPAQIWYICKDHNGTYYMRPKCSSVRVLDVRADTMGAMIWDYGGSSHNPQRFTVNKVSAPTYTVAYNANGGSGAPYAQTKTYSKTLTLSNTKPTRIGYTFLGWSTSKTATSATYQPGASYTANSGTTLYAVWKIDTYKIYYNANGGSGAPSEQTKTYGKALTLSNTKPTRTGYTFLGWSTSKTATSATYQSGGSYTVNAGTTLYAVWKINTYTVSYNANGGSGVPTVQTKTYNQTLTLSSTKPTRIGYTFLGWSTNQTATSATYQPGANYTANAGTTLYAVWKSTMVNLGDDFYANIVLVKNQYRLSLSGNNAVAQTSNNSDSQVWYFDRLSDGGYTIKNCNNDRYLDVVNVEDADRVNVQTYLYNGCAAQIWYVYSNSYGSYYIRPKCSATRVLDVDSSSLNLQLWTWSSGSHDPQQFTINKVNAPKYTISYDANGGSGAPSAQSKTYNQTLNLSSTNPTRIGYTFMGWSTSKTATSATYQAGASYTANAGITLYAVWRADFINLGTRNYTSIPGRGSGSLFVRISYSGTNQYLTNTSGNKNDTSYANVALKTSSNATQQVWEMIRQSDGSYKIASAFDERVLDVNGTKSDNNTNIGMYKWLGNNGQKWYIYKENGKYVLKPINAPNSYLTAAGTTDGSNIRLYDSSETRRYFEIEILEEPGQSKLKVDVAGSRSVPTKISWTATSNTTWYNLYIYDGVCWNSNVVKAVTSISGTSVEVQLPPGTYQMHLTSQNYFVWKNSNVVEFTVAEDVYKITYNANGGTGVPSEQTKAYGQTLTLSNTKPTKEGCTFLGWSTSTTATHATYLAGGGYTANAGATLYAVWKKDTYTVTFDANGGNCATFSKTVCYSDSYGELPIPERSGYTFNGWSLNIDGSTKVGTDTIYNSTSNQVLYAQWLVTPVKVTGIEAVYENGKVTITWDDCNAVSYKVSRADGDGSYRNLTYKATAKGYVDDSLVEEQTYNYRIAAYFYDENGELVQGKVSDLVQVVTTVYTISYNANGGKGAPSEQMKGFGTTLILSNVMPTREGYTFVGWSISASSTSAAYQAGGCYTGNSDTTLYAVWKKNAYTISFNANGGTCATLHKSVFYNNTYGELPIPERSGYTFNGWCLSVNGGTKVDTDTIYNSTSNQVLYAQWLVTPVKVTGIEAVYEKGKIIITWDDCNAVSYKVSRADGDGSYRNLTYKATAEGYIDDNIEEGQIYNYRVAAYFYDGNGELVQGKVSDLVQVVATTYTVSYNANGGYGAPSEQVKTYGKTLTLSDVKPTRSGYTFIGWSTSDTAASVTHQAGEIYVENADITLYAVWTKNTYTIIFDSNGGNCTTLNKTVFYGDHYGELPIPERSGYTFNGWYLSVDGDTRIDAGTVYDSTSNQVLYAQWLVTPVKVTGVNAVCENGKVTITWNDCNAVSYKVSRADGDGSYRNLTYKATSAGYVDENLVDGQVYKYRIAAYFYDENGELVQGEISELIKVVVNVEVV